MSCERADCSHNQKSRRYITKASFHLDEALYSTYLSLRSSIDMSELLAFVLEHEQFRKCVSRKTEQIRQMLTTLIRARLSSLYSDFRNLKTTNPNGYHANVTAWKTILSAAIAAGKGPDSNKLVLTANDDLVSSLQTRECGRPLALGVVITEAVHSKEIWSLDAFLARQESIYAWSYVGAALNWGLVKVGVRGQRVDTRGMLHGRFVVVKNVEEVAKHITATIATRPSLIDRIFTTDLFASELAPTLSATDLKVLLRHLSRDNPVCAYSGNTIKFLAPGEPATITETDTTIAHLRSLLLSMSIRITQLSTDIALCTARAQAAVASKNRSVALGALKSRKTAEGVLATQLRTRGQVEEVMMSIQTAADNIELMKILDRSSKVLKGLNKEIGGAERVDSVLDKLREETETVEEVNRVIAEGGVVIDEEVVEDELEAMLMEVKDAEREEKVRKELDEIPAVRESKKHADLERQLSDSLKGMNLGEKEEGKEKKKEEGMAEKKMVHAS